MPWPGYAGSVVERADVLRLVEQGCDYPEAGAALGIPAGLAYLLATGIPADGSDTVTGVQRQRPGMLPAHSQRLVNPRQVNPTARPDVREWLRRRALDDPQMQAAAGRKA
jgi:hypothetical protein